MNTFEKDLKQQSVNLRQIHLWQVTNRCWVRLQENGQEKIQLISELVQVLKKERKKKIWNKDDVAWGLTEIVYKCVHEHVYV